MVELWWFEIKDIQKNKSGLIEYYTLKSFNKFILQKPYINKITLKFYANETDLINALKSNKIDQISSITPENAKKLKEEKYKQKYCKRKFCSLDSLLLLVL